MTNRLERQWPDRETGRAELYLVLVGLCLCVGDVKYSSTVAHSAIPCKHFLFNTNTVRGKRKPPFPAKTLVRAKNDGLTPVALRAKRPLIAPSRPSVSRLGPLSSLLGAGKWGAGGRTTVRPALAPQLSCKRCVFAAIFPGHYCFNTNTVRRSFTAKTVLRGNPTGSIAPVGRAALGISTLSRQRGG